MSFHVARTVVVALATGIGWSTQKLLQLVRWQVNAVAHFENRFVQFQDQLLFRLFSSACGPLELDSWRLQKHSRCGALRLFDLAITLIALLPFGGLWYLTGSDFRFGHILPWVPHVLHDAHPGSGHCFVLFEFAAAIWNIFFLIWLLREYFDATTAASSKSLRLLCASGVAIVLVVVGYSFLIAESAAARLLGETLLEIFECSVNVAFVLRFRGNKIAVQVFISNLCLCLPSAAAYLTLLAYVVVASPVGPGLLSFAAGASAFNMVLNASIVMLSLGRKREFESNSRDTGQSRRQAGSNSL